MVEEAEQPGAPPHGVEDNQPDKEDWEPDASGSSQAGVKFAVDCWHSLFYAVLLSFAVLILLAFIHACAFGG